MQPGNPFSGPNFADRLGRLPGVQFLRNSGKNYPEHHCFYGFVEAFGSQFEIGGIRVSGIQDRK